MTGRPIRRLLHCGRRASLSKRMEIPARKMPRKMLDAVSFLREVETHEAPEARSSRRLRRRQHGHGRGPRGKAPGRA